MGRWKGLKLMSLKERTRNKATLPTVWWHEGRIKPGSDVGQGSSLHFCDCVAVCNAKGIIEVVLLIEQWMNEKDCVVVVTKKEDGTPYH